MVIRLALGLLWTLIHKVVMGMIRTVITIFYRMVGPLIFMTGKYSIGIIRVWDHCHHIEGNYPSVLKCVWNYCSNPT